ncbi:type-F conjugative transfer system secretin TraK [Massilia sp. YMA4]|uniref:Type-F conjugative transfer system secretin TraK n=1 Tax=[Empedobacter] haloabium TaxID=592317 RepID=A0ABZ1URV6_9BURK|nr:type-F conjugative transfer system secretin TraK [Massilia sp. YMA4]AXA91337.1 conjugal transfer pilus assembly protein TraK [Massilia sp. YMA4]
MENRAWLAPMLLATSMMASVDCCAVQRKEVHDGLSVEAVVSLREITRIRVEDSMITGVVGKVHPASGCGAPRESSAAATAQLAAVSTAAEAIVTCDMTKGEIYLQVKGRDKKPINLFVSTNRATYALILRKADVPSDTIVLVDALAGRTAASQSATRSRHDSYIKKIKTFMRAMVGDRTPDDVRSESVNLVLPLWQEASLRMVNKYQGRNLIGERYVLTNTSETTLSLAEQEFDRTGSEVLAIAIANHNLRPYESTAVYIVRSEVQP